MSQYSLIVLKRCKGAVKSEIALATERVDDVVSFMRKMTCQPGDIVNNYIVVIATDNGSEVYHGDPTKLGELDLKLREIFKYGGILERVKTAQKHRSAGEERIEKLKGYVREQEQWIEKCGGDLHGYIAHYGAEDSPTRYGAGGPKIYEADLAALKEWQDKLAEAEKGLR